MTQSPIRVIIYFAQAATSSPALDAVIADACRCQPIFLRQYNDNALIYQVTLPPADTFASFEKALLTAGIPFGIQIVEQDRVMQHQ